MSKIEKDYYPYPGEDHYYQMTNVNSPKNKAKPVHTKTYTTEEVDTMINYVLSKINNSKHVVTESVSFDQLPVPSENNSGVIYNVIDGFISDDRFLDGAGKHYPEGSNVIIVFNNGTFKFDVMAGEIGKATDSEISDIIDDIYPDE